MLQQFFGRTANPKTCSSLISKNILLAGKRTSMRLEPDMWEALFEIAGREGMSIHDLCTLIDQRRVSSSLTAAVRVFLMTYYRQAAYKATHTDQITLNNTEVIV